MQLCELLGIARGVTALIGSGGKTTAMYTLARELQQRGSVVCCTTTRIFPPEHLPVYEGNCPDELVELLLEHGCVCAGTHAENGKLGASPIAMETLTGLADFVLVEADGSKGLPLKAHLSHEPVIPGAAKNVILLVGASGFGERAEDCVHRVERFCELAGISGEDTVTAESVAAVIAKEGFAGKVFVNQVETEEQWKQAKELAELLSVPVYAGALKRGEWQWLS